MEATINANILEKAAADLLNAGLGLSAIATARFETLKSDLTTAVDELVARGAADQSEGAQALRSGIDQGFKALAGARGEIEGRVGALVEKVKPVA